MGAEIRVRQESVQRVAVTAGCRVKLAASLVCHAGDAKAPARNTPGGHIKRQLPLAREGPWTASWSSGRATAITMPSRSLRPASSITSTASRGSILRDADRAEDAAQEALVRCWRDLPSLREVDRFDAWLGRLLMHAINDEFRRGLALPGQHHRPGPRALDHRCRPRHRRPRAPRPRLRPTLARAPQRGRPSTHLGLSIEETASTPLGSRSGQRSPGCTTRPRPCVEHSRPTHEPRSQEVSA